MNDGTTIAIPILHKVEILTRNEGGDGQFFYL